MDFSLEKSEDVLVTQVVVRRATFLESLQFQNLLSTEIESGYRKVVIDLSNCSSIDPAFFSAIILTYRKLVNNGGNLKIVKPGNYLDDREKLEMSLRVFEMYSSKEEAVESYRMIFNKPSEDLQRNNNEIAV